MSRVLVVDDDLGTRETFKQILRLDGFDVGVAATAADALTVVHRCAVDMALVDFRLTDVDGLQLLSWIRADRPAVRTILMTGFGSSELALEADRLGAVAYLEKPLDQDQLVRVVRQHTSPRSTPEARPGWYTVRVRAVIEERYSDCSFGPSAAADVLNVTLAHLSREVRSDLGLTVGELLRERRLREVRRLLEESTLRVREIARRTGFTNSSRLDHLFKRLYGLSPVEYRSSIRNRS